LSHNFIILDDYEPHGFVERNFPKFPLHLSSEEKSQMTNLKDELKDAIKNEPSMVDFKVDKLERVNKVYTE
jgi:hypothetical protein